jgi:hypothetical protein
LRNTNCSELDPRQHVGSGSSFPLRSGIDALLADGVRVLVIE